MSLLTPREIVSELDKYIIAQQEAKRMVAIAMRNRWRRQRLDPELAEEIAPKNILMIGPTGVGKTEIARRLATLAGSPFIKVEATKFTEVGYVGRDVESIIRDLMEIGIALVREEHEAQVRVKAEGAAEERLLDLLLPNSGTAEPTEPDAPKGSPLGNVIAVGPDGSGDATAPPKGESTRDKLRRLWRDGKLDDRTVELQVSGGAPRLGISSMSGMPGVEDMEVQFKDMFSKIFPKRTKTRSMNVRRAYEHLVEEEADKLVDMDAVVMTAKDRVEQSGIVFLDELDKVVSTSEGKHGGDVSREGVQRDLLPIVEGSSVNTKHGMIRTDHILFIAAGAFHMAKPSDLAPELQGRFPIRVELSALGADEFYRIITEPKNALTKQYTALLGTEGIELSFTDEALKEVAAFAERTNQETENIGARRLATIFERILSDLSFDAPDRGGAQVTVDADYVREALKDVWEDRDLSRYIL